ncbi:hypothetical protein ACGFX7_12590 [Streptomyces harbinensis]|uniref:hypothetical protein n=1 Tax=Streptomyces harbinensis TaxID=1176198 RepID=UPI0037112A80
MNSANLTPAGPGCALCARPGNFGNIRSGEPHSGLCPSCITAGRSARDAVEAAVLIVARQYLDTASELDIHQASAPELAFHLTALMRSLRSVLHLFDVPAAPGEQQS